MHVCKRNPSEDTSCPLGNLGKISRNCNSVAHDLCQMARRDVCGGSVTNCGANLRVEIDFE
jgi:hypothetical protein